MLDTGDTVLNGVQCLPSGSYVLVRQGLGWRPGRSCVATWSGEDRALDRAVVWTSREEKGLKLRARGEIHKAC